MSKYVTPALPQASDDDIVIFDALFRQCSTIGATPGGGLHRLAASESDKKVRDAFCEWLSGQGFEVRIDAIGNIFGLMTFTPGAPYVLCGSHLDSQPNAGRFDGVYGVTAGAVAVASLGRQLRQRQEIAPCNLAVVNWTNEEGARFQPSLIGSSVFTGAMSLEAGWNSRDPQGITLKQALAGIEYLGERLETLPLSAYIEMHVEQGPNLENAAAGMGIVQDTWAALKWRVKFTGEQNHTGPALMASRRDALLAAAMTIVAVREEAGRHGLAMHSSVGRLEITPNSPNVVAAETVLHIEFRSADEALLAAAAARFSAVMHEIAAKTQTEVSVLASQLRACQRLHPALSEIARRTGEELGFSVMKTRSVAGHDAISLSYHCPSCLVFIPSHKGLSHNEAEFTDQRDMHNGVNFLTAFLYRACSAPEAYSNKALKEAQPC